MARVDSHSRSTMERRGKQPHGNRFLFCRLGSNFMINFGLRTKKGTILIGMVFFLILISRAVSADPLSVVPSALNLTLTSGQLVTYRLEVTNLEDSPLWAQCVYDSGWMLVSPSEFKILPGTTRSVLAIFFISREEDPQRKGKIEFRTAEAGKQATVEVVSTAPPIRRVAAEEGKTEIRAGAERLEKLEKEIRERDKNIEELQREIEKAKSAYNLDPQKIDSMKKREQLKLLYDTLGENLKSEVEKGEIRITNGDEKRIAIIIPGLFVSDQADPDKKKLAILEKTGQVLGREAFGKKIEIRGYADALLGKEAKKRFPSAWHLSGARASAVAKILQWKIGINGKYLTVVGRASYPSPDDQTTGAERNRRIEIAVSME